MTRRIALSLFLLLALSGSVFADAAPAGDAAASVRTFQFKYKDAGTAAALIKTLMSAHGSFSIQPSSNSLVITDSPENLKSIAAALQQYDAAPQAFKLSVRLVAAAKVNPGAVPKMPGELKDVAAKLSFGPYNSFDLLGNTNIDGREGDPGILEMENGYRADFKFGEYDPASDSLRIADFKLQRLSPEQQNQLTQLLKTSLNLKLGQTYIIGAAKVPESQRALMLIIAAKR